MQPAFRVEALHRYEELSFQSTPKEAYAALKHLERATLELIPLLGILQI